MKTRAIVNPRSASGKTGSRWPALQDRLREHLPQLDSVLTEASGHATALTREAIADGVEQILVVGGDGTVNEVVNGLMQDDRPVAPDVVLAIMMLGTGGDFRKSLGIGADVEDYIERLLHGTVRSIDVGRIELHDREGRPSVRYFDNIASFGLSGGVVEEINRGGLSKRLGGTFAFKWASFKATVRHRNLPVQIRIDDEDPFELRTSIVAVCNGQFFGGGMWIAPQAQLDDGMFDIVMISDLSTLDFIKHSGALYRGEHLELDKVQVRRGRKLVATPPPEARWVIDVDGEAPGLLPATFEILPGALKVRS